MAQIDWTRGEIILATSLANAHEWRQLSEDHPDVVKLSKLLRAAKLHPVSSRDDAFRSPGSVRRKMADIRTKHPNYTGKPTKGNQLEHDVLRDFLDDPAGMAAETDAVRAALQSEDLDVPEALELRESVLEGRVLLVRHQRRERSPALRRKKLKDCERRGQRIACEVCDFDFLVTYGDRGRGYIEVHHVLPLHVSGEVATELEDLALLCSNCHRMVHKTPWTTPTQLRVVVRAQSSAGGPLTTPRHTDAPSPGEQVRGHWVNLGT
ncbi:HNH endonuclease [Rathayibacter sp. AY1A3]|uniref:HNH endonuclease n=1 Tax=Rathayibacter sp. AY1A3 TaxID=2080521 RepID=UPI000CE891EC|nr:HNH endonuclease [Rathayibacter sp. AY1A3]PPF39168.1 HNH endonuclease [Rathayibacter sp. AY1A3]